MNKPVLNPKSVEITRGPLPGSRKIHLDGVPFREVALSGGEAPIRLYDTSGPYTDETVKIDIEKGLAPKRAQWIAERGCAALLMGAGPTLMAYHGARVASMATSPIAIAVPSSKGLIALDMSASTISNGKILQARATGAALPEGAVLTGTGEPTRVRAWPSCSKCWPACLRQRLSRRRRWARKKARGTPPIPRCL